jgi:hypothetical protein
VVPPSLIGFCQPGRDDPNSLPSQGVRDEQQATFHHAERHETFLGVVLTIVIPFDGEDVLEHLPRDFKGDAVIPPITGGFDVVSFESFILHNILLNSSFVNCP